MDFKISNAIAFGVNEYVLKKDDKSMKGYVDQIAGYICSSLAYPFQVIQFSKYIVHSILLFLF